MQSTGPLDINDAPSTTLTKHHVLQIFLFFNRTALHSAENSRKSWLDNALYGTKCCDGTNLFNEMNLFSKTLQATQNTEQVSLGSSLSVGTNTPPNCTLLSVEKYCRYMYIYTTLKVLILSQQPQENNMTICSF